MKHTAKIKGFFNRLLRAFWMRGNRAFEREVRSVLKVAWEDNRPLHLGYAASWARAGFNEHAGRYVRDYFERTGRFPEGNHFISERRARLIYFAPRSAEPSSASYIDDLGTAPKSE